MNRCLQTQVHLTNDRTRKRTKNDSIEDDSDRFRLIQLPSIASRNALALAIILVTRIVVTIAFQSELRNETFLLEGDNTIGTDRRLTKQYQLTYFDRRPLTGQSNPLSTATSDNCNISDGCLSAAKESVQTYYSNQTDQADDKFDSTDKNFTEYTQTELWLVKQWYDILFRATFVVLIVIFGVLGNATIIYSMLKFKTIRSKPTNIFILNTALADLLTTIVCPNTALFSSIYQMYVLGPFVCTFEGFFKSEYITTVVLV